MKFAIILTRNREFPHRPIDWSFGATGKIRSPDFHSPVTIYLAFRLEYALNSESPVLGPWRRTMFQPTIVRITR